MTFGRASERGLPQNDYDKSGGTESAAAFWSSENPDDLRAASRWFAEHVTLFGEPYTLDDDQVRAAIDSHRNTLVTARAGSGKTRVIVAKVAYLVARCGLTLDEILIFMFNRTAAAEVNERIGAVAIDGVKLATGDIKVASTFHKFALDLVKNSGAQPQLISESENSTLIYSALQQTLTARNHRVSLPTFRELLSIAQGFTARAGQQFPGHAGLQPLGDAVNSFCARHRHDPDYQRKIFWHQIAYATYQNYLQRFKSPKTNFNLLMHDASELLVADAAVAHGFSELRRLDAKASVAQNHGPSQSEGFDFERAPLVKKNHDNRCLWNQKLSKIKYILIDEYQDFSFLFYRLIQSLRLVAPHSHLFAVGDDWQAINRFAGSDVDYFLNFAQYFPDNCVNIPLATNYRSARKIVEHANRFMLTNYDPNAIPAKPFHREAGKIKTHNPANLRFDATDIAEDCLGDGRFQLALASVTGNPDPAKIPLRAAKLLKQIYKIAKSHPRAPIMLLHRHNFTTCDSISLEAIHLALKQTLIKDRIVTPEAFARQVRYMTMHKSKGLESEVVILLEVNHEVVASAHPHATIFSIFGDSRAAEVADQQRLLYVAMTRAKKHLYILSSDKTPPI